MSVDLRKFVYALEPVRRKRQWQLDALQIKLGKAQSTLSEAQREIRVLQNDAERVTQEVRLALLNRLDPHGHRSGLMWLAQLRKRIQEQQHTVDLLRQQRDDIRQACTVEHQQLEALTQHRKKSEAEYLLIEQNRQDTEADRDWIARSMRPDRST